VSLSVMVCETVQIFTVCSRELTTDFRAVIILLCYDI